MPVQVYDLSIPPFQIRLETDISLVSDSIEKLYSKENLLIGNENQFFDFHIKVTTPTLYRKYFRPQAQFFSDGKAPFKPLPISQAYPFFEWGLNWCIASYTYQYLILHAAVIEKNNQAIILPGKPGAGKSTLCAALVCSGWRLLSDEMAVIDLQTLELLPVVRPVSLKNESIEIISEFAPDAEFGDTFFDTAKGVVSHLKPPEESMKNNRRRAKAHTIIFPQFTSQADMKLTKKSRAETVLELARNSFNYSVLGQQGFDVLCELVTEINCFEFEYSSLDEAIKQFETLIEKK